MDAYNNRRGRRSFRSPQKQQGVVLVMLTIAMTVLLLAGAMALDVGHLTLNKGRLQNMVDAAALSAAKTLDLGGDQDAAEQSAIDTLALNNGEDGNTELDLDSATITVQFSDELPFTSGGSADAKYVRVIVSNAPLQPFLMQLVTNVKNVGASAVAGPSSSLNYMCNVVPMMVCAKSDTETGGGPNSYWGYEYGDIEVLKIAPTNDSPIGSGNFQLITLYDDEGNPQTGADALAKKMAGENESCLSTDQEIPTEPGTAAGPVTALNTRLGISKAYSGHGLNPTDHPPDLVTDQPATAIEVDKDGNLILPDGFDPNSALEAGTYAHYLEQYSKIEPGCLDGSGECSLDGKPERRVLQLPMGKCDGLKNGRNSVPFAGLACFYLMQEVTTKDKYVLGQFIDGCEAPEGLPGINPSVNGPYRIQLYKDPASGDS